jgi:predicted transcriptional regulator
MKRLSVPLTPELHRQLKILAALRETSVAEIVRSALSGAMEPAALHTQQPPSLTTTMHTRPLETRQ